MHDSAVVENKRLRLVHGGREHLTEQQQDDDCLELLKQAIDCLPIRTGITITDARGSIVYASAVEAAMHGYEPDELVGKDQGILGPALKSPSLRNVRGLRQREALNVRKNGDRFPVQISSVPVMNQKGRMIGVVTAYEDISCRKESEQQIEHLAFYDTVTQLPNRTLLMDRLRQSVALAHREGRELALLFLDLDNFKHLNETQGLLTGDKFLQEVAGRLSGCLPESSTVARIGGDEFVVLLPSIAEESPAATARRIQGVFSEPFEIDGLQIYSSASIGISVYPHDAHDAETLFTCADAAMYHAKEEGKSNFQFFCRDMNDTIMRRVALESCMRQGIARGEFFMQYQPQWDLKEDRLIGVEALLRWESEELGVVGPGEFIPVAETSGLILELGEMVLLTACLQAKIWGEHYGRFTVAVNISGRQFRQPDFLQTVARIIDETGVDPCFLELEFTESVIMEKAEKNIDALRALKEMGVRVSIDDFGTGYSSLSYLKHFPIDTIKIDRSFIKEVDSKRDDAAITEAILSMAHSLKLRVVAEGVETRAQLQFLRERNCDGAQGYYLATPMSESELVGYLQRAKEKRELFCHGSAAVTS